MAWTGARKLLFHLDPERAHALAAGALRVLGSTGGVARPRPDAALRVRCLGLDFESPLGMAAGFDKGEVLVRGLHALGFGHVEVGTITPRPQAGNEPPRLFRLPEHRALINRMGFNNQGVDACGERLSRLPREGRGIVGVNVGRNKSTPNERAADDYLAAIDGLHRWADYLVVNLSSPNTPGLRELQERGALERLLGACVDRARPLGKPLLVKLAPDLAPQALDEAVDVAVACGASGIIATNTTLQRPGDVAAHPRAGEAGGLSGAPLAPLALASLRRAFARAARRIPVVGVGGIMDAAGAWARIRAGASLVQIYTGLIYAGPALPRRVLEELPELMRRDGFGSIEEAIGSEGVVD
jgi:dihydroorotate dehydrogenase